MVNSKMANISYFNFQFIIFNFQFSNGSNLVVVMWINSTSGKKMILFILIMYLKSVGCIFHPTD